MKLSHTSTTAAGAGPNSTASVMKKVSATEMLALLRGRLGNDADTELRIAAAEQAKITRLRLEKL